MSHNSIKKLTVTAMFIAISVVLVYFIHFPIIPTVAFLEYDPADIPILICALAFGPIPGIIITVAASAIQALTVSAQSGLYGFIMHVIATCTLSTVSSVIYSKFRSTKGLLVALICGAVAMGLIMMPANHFITPIFTGWPIETVDALLLPAILPFNLIKAGINSLVTFLIYSQIRRFFEPTESDR